MSHRPPAALAPSAPPTAEELRAVFERPQPFTVGLEEEVLLLDPASLELVPNAPVVLAALSGDRRFKPELPTSQLEILTPPLADVRTAAREIAAARRALAAAAEDAARPVATGYHPFSAREGELSSDPRYAEIVEEYGPVARTQLVSSLQVHVAVGGAERSLAVYNSLRSYLPELAALAANAPFRDGRDSGLASVRPKVSEALPRQGVPPALASWEDFADALAWGAAAGTVSEPRLWWWELRPHSTFGTLELRVPDTQTTVAEVAAVAAVAHALVAWLAERYDARDPLPVHPRWRIEENRWSASRHGVDGTLADLQTGERRTTRERLHGLVDVLAPTAARLGCAAELADARSLVEVNGAIRQRKVAAEAGVHGLAGWLADCFLAGCCAVGVTG